MNTPADIHTIIRISSDDLDYNVGDTIMGYKIAHIVDLSDNHLMFGIYVYTDKEYSYRNIQKYLTIYPKCTVRVFHKLQPLIPLTD